MERTLENGYINIEDIDLSVEQILQTKADLDLVENPYADKKHTVKIMGCNKS